MSKDIKDFIPFYMGQKIIFPERGANQARVFTVTGSIYDSMGTDKDFHKHEKRCLILRPLSSLTNEERTERGKAIIQYGKEFIDAEYHRWMLSKGFDIFNLIPEGLAIDKTTLK
jgi:hypothetical protein